MFFFFLSNLRHPDKGIHVFAGQFLPYGVKYEIFSTLLTFKHGSFSSIETVTEIAVQIHMLILVYILCCATFYLLLT